MGQLLRRATWFCWLYFYLNLSNLSVYLLLFLKLLVYVTCLPHGHYEIYNTGIMFINLQYLDAGPVNPNAKWLAECFDGQALVGLRDLGDDFEDLTTAKCRTAFPGKAPTYGYYPYYERCQTRNITHKEEFLCFDPERYPNSINTFITALWDDDDSFLLWGFRSSKPFIGTAFKCCGTPPGYEIDYTSCQVRYTHNEFWEYYDTTHFVVECPDTFVMTGIGVVANPIDYDLHYDWIQCCPLVYQPVPTSSRTIFGPPGLDVSGFREFQHYYAHPVPDDLTLRASTSTQSPSTVFPARGGNFSGTPTTTRRPRIPGTGNAGAATAIRTTNAGQRQESAQAGNRQDVSSGVQNL